MAQYFTSKAEGIERAKERKRSADRDSVYDGSALGGAGALHTVSPGRRAGIQLTSEDCTKCGKHTPHKSGICLYCQGVASYASPQRIGAKRYRFAMQRVRRDKRSALHAAAEASRLKFEGPGSG